MNNDHMTEGKYLFSVPPHTTAVSLIVFSGSGEYIKSIKKENEMTDKLKVLQALANIKEEADEFSHLDESGFNDEIMKAIADLRKEERENAIRDAARVIVELNANAQKAIESHRAELRKIRGKEKLLIGCIETLAVAAAYGRETNNFLPLEAAVSGHSAKFFIIKQTLSDANNPAKITEADYDRLLKVVRDTQKKAKASSVKKS